MHSQEEKSNNYNREKHLEFILSAINRTNNLIVICKVSAFLAAAILIILNLRADETLISSLILQIFLWYKDSQYTVLSKCFYKLYEDVRKNDYSADPYTINIDKIKPQMRSVKRTMFSTTKAFYPIMIFLTQFLADLITPRIIP